MRSYKVDTGRRPPSSGFVEIWASGDTISEFIQSVIGPAPVVAHTVPELSVPLRPQWRGVASLVFPISPNPGRRQKVVMCHDRNPVHIIEKIVETGQTI